MLCRLPGMWRLLPNIDGAYEVEISSNWSVIRARNEGLEPEVSSDGDVALFNRVGRATITARLLHQSSREVFLKRCDEVIEAHYLVVRFADGSKRILPIFSVGPQDRIGTLQGRDEGLQVALCLGRSLKRRCKRREPSFRGRGTLSRLGSGSRSLRLREPGAALRIWRANSNRALLDPRLDQAAHGMAAAVKTA